MTILINLYSLNKRAALAEVEAVALHVPRHYRVIIWRSTYFQCNLGTNSDTLRSSLASWSSFRPWPIVCGTWRSSYGRDADWSSDSAHIHTYTTCTYYLDSMGHYHPWLSTPHSSFQLMLILTSTIPSSVSCRGCPNYLKPLYRYMVCFFGPSVALINTGDTLAQSACSATPSLCIAYAFIHIIFRRPLNKRHQQINSLLEYVLFDHSAKSSW